MHALLTKRRSDRKKKSANKNHELCPSHCLWKSQGILTKLQEKKRAQEKTYPPQPLPHLQESPQPQFPPQHDILPRAVGTEIHNGQDAPNRNQDDTCKHSRLTASLGQGRALIYRGGEWRDRRPRGDIVAGPAHAYRSKGRVSEFPPGKPSSCWWAMYAFLSRRIIASPNQSIRRPRLPSWDIYLRLMISPRGLYPVRQSVFSIFLFLPRILYKPNGFGIRIFVNKKNSFCDNFILSWIDPYWTGLTY